MELHSLLTILSGKGVKLSANGSLLDINAPTGVITPELRASLAEHKAEIIRLLRQNDQRVNSETLPTIIPAPNQRYEPFPLTDMQHAFWVGRSGVLELGAVANHGYYEIEGRALNLDRLNWALQRLIDRHDMLRAIVLPDGRQQVKETVPPYQIQVIDLSGKDGNVVGKVLEEIRDRMSHQVLPSDQWPLFEFCATRLDEERVRLHISYDLQVFDAWSLFRLFDEWVQLYENSQATLPPLDISFRDYVLAEQALQTTEWYARSQAYWFNRIDSLPAAPDLPLAKHPRDLKQHRSKRHESRLGQTDWRQLKQRAARAGLTPSGVLLAAFAEIIGRWSKNSQFTINLALFNRLPLTSPSQRYLRRLYLRHPLSRRSLISRVIYRPSCPPSKTTVARFRASLLQWGARNTGTGSQKRDRSHRYANHLYQHSRFQFAWPGNLDIQPLRRTDLRHQSGLPSLDGCSSLGGKGSIDVQLGLSLNNSFLKAWLGICLRLIAVCSGRSRPPNLAGWK